MENKVCKGIVLSGGSGTRLYPITKGVSKQQLPLFNKPLIYYPISVLMLAGIRDILIITTPEDQASFQRLLGDGSDYGVNFTYAVQPKPEGLGQAFLIADECGFLTENDSCMMILGDNIFHGPNFTYMLHLAVDYAEMKNKATVFGYRVKDPQRFGIAEVDNQMNCIGIEEKPKEPKSDIAVLGLYCYPSDIIQKAKQNKPSARGELEITTINQMYVDEKRLKLEILGRGFSWFDAGTFDSLNDATNYIATIERNQGLMIASLEEIAYRKGWINKEKLIKLGESMIKNSYGQYLINLANSKTF